MSSFRKMRLVNEPINPTFDVSSVLKQQTPINVARLSDLDREIESVLNQNIDDNIKAKLYSQTLRRFLSYKKLKEHDEIQKQDKYLKDLRKALLKGKKQQIIYVEAKKRFKTPKKPRKKKTYISSSEVDSDMFYDIESPTTPTLSPESKRSYKESVDEINSKAPKKKKSKKTKQRKIKDQPEDLVSLSDPEPFNILESNWKTY